jgi:hypothetical protein
MWIWNNSKKEGGIMEGLIKIQGALKAPKGQMNRFGNYKYRSCEDIIEAVKPLLSLNNMSLMISDEIVLIGDRFYIKATATVTSGKESVSTTAYAREPLDKKGMDTAQITGATSSYARKYALNGLFCIDDTKDADATNKHDKEEKAPDMRKGSETAWMTPETKAEVLRLKEKYHIIDSAFLDRIDKLYGTGLDGLTEVEARDLILKMKEKFNA